MDFEGFLNELQGLNDRTSNEKEKKSSSQTHRAKKNRSMLDSQNTTRSRTPSNDSSKQTNTSSRDSSSSYPRQPNYFSNSDAMSRLSSNLLNDDDSPTATSEKDLGNEHFKKNKFSEAIECYSRSIALSPTSVAFANRAMAYLKIKKYEGAENDCTEALNLDDRYVKAYSRRATARKELGRFKESIEDSEFALRLEPNNQELKKLYSEAKALYDKEMLKQIRDSSKPHPPGIKIVEKSDVKVQGHNKLNGLSRNDLQSSGPTAVHKNYIGVKNKSEIDLLELAARATSLHMAKSKKDIKIPKTAYEFEVTWRAISEDSALQVNLLKSISPITLPQLFKNALSVSVLASIVKCIATFFKDEPEIAIDILDNLTRISRFDMIVLSFPPPYRTDFHRIWNDVFTSNDIPAKHQAALSKLQPKFCPRL
ncbi:Serine/threonine-protein phosphatase 5 [Zostera marina]|uniref:Serine/threonine-protein phosphatase 5 n=1 Tax=Zostera marina TaxID=29655 RepID=A0A0K9NU72_ZOSMR|nr:Serine/threonine-protein phosphatase 5 [Zostera marina]